MPPAAAWLKRVAVTGPCVPGLVAATIVLASGPYPAGAQIPPVRYEGEMISTARSSMPDDGEGTVQLGSTASINASSYVWQPWFAEVGANLDVSKVDTFGAAESNSLFTTGSGRVQVFPRSHFPFSAFVTVTDDRSEFESTVVEERQTRRTRFGVSQRYRPMNGAGQYFARVERAIENGEPDLREETRDRLELQMAHHLGPHSFDTSLHLEQTDQENPGAAFRDIVATTQHSYRPAADISIENLATFIENTGESNGFDFSTRDAEFSSFATWRPETLPLTMTGNLRADSIDTRSGAASSSSQSLSGDVNANYRVTPAFQVSGNLGASVSSGDSVATSQGATVSYSPESVDLGGFGYSWFATASASNRTGDTTDASRTVGGNAGHGVTRMFPLDEAGAFGLSIALNQAAGASFDSVDDGEHSLTHSASASLRHSGFQSTSNLSFNAQDNRNFTSTGVGDTTLQSGTLQFSHDSRLWRYASLGGSLNLSMTRQTFQDRSETFPSSSLNLSFRHGRLFGIRRLRFSSELSTSSDSLGFITAGEDGRREISWTNRLDYSIGRVDVRVTGAVSDVNGRTNSFVFFTMRRRFGGVL